MQTPARLLVLLLLFTTAAFGADRSLASARRAQAMLGPDVWTRVIRVENDAARSRYPHSLHALVFELAGILWFYTDHDGTQSFSLRRDRLAEEKADFGRLLRDIEPGFRRWSVVLDERAARATTKTRLPNGCFIESFAILRARLAQGAAVLNPKLLSYYAQSVRGERQGHTVLAYETSDGVEIIDPATPAAVLRLPGALVGDALELARAVEGRVVAKARFVPVNLAPADALLVAARAGSLEPAPAHASRGRS